MRLVVLILVAHSIVGSCQECPAAFDIPSLWPISERGQSITGYFLEDRGTHLHQGIDIAGKHSILAAGNGVLKLDYDRGYGYYMRIEHDCNYETVYAHFNVETLAVYDGQYVCGGAHLAYTGNSGRSTGTHLHFEIIKNNRRIDPLTYFLDRLNDNYE